MRAKRYLRPNVVLEPRINQWYAGPYLISPARAAMVITFSHVEIMKSFVQSPAAHEQAMTTPELVGGPFIDHPAARAKEVVELLRRTLAEQAHMLQLARDLKTFDLFLRREGSGLSLEPLYARLPPSLRGHVELVYDISSQPSIRLLEALLYRGRYGNQRAQSVALGLLVADHRKFILSTPRLASGGEGDDQLVIRRPFAAPELDEIAAAQSAAIDVDAMADRLEFGPGERERFHDLFHDQPRPPRSAFMDGDKMRIRYFGHASVLVEARGKSVFIDPLYSYDYPGVDGCPRFTSADLPDRIDYAVITHGHHDHLVLEALLPLRHRIGCVVVPRSGAGALEDPSLKLMLRQLGFPSVVDLDDLESVGDDDVEVIAVPFFGEHCDLNIRGKAGYCVRAGGRSALFLADSNNLQPEAYAHVHAAIGRVDHLFIGMECEGAPLSWLYGPLLSQPLDRKKDDSRRTQGSDSGKALELVSRFSPSEVDVYAMGQEPWLSHIFPKRYAADALPMAESDKFVAACRARGLAAERLFGRKEIVR